MLINSLIDEKDSGTVSGMSCTSGFTTRFDELSQKLKRRKEQKRKKNKERNDNELKEVSEEYDIQTIVSGLTRASEFPERRDPPNLIPDVEDDLDQSAEWPDDESSGLRGHDGGHHRGHHVISIMDGNQVVAKDKIPCSQEKRVFQRRKENKVPLSEPRGKENRRQEKRDFHRRKENKVPLSEPRGKENRRQDDRVFHRHKDNKVPLSEPRGKESPPSKVDTISKTDPESGYEVMLTPEPDGTKFNDGRNKVPMEPSGTKIEALILNCAMKNENQRNSTNNKSRRRPPTVLMKDKDVELIYQSLGTDISEQRDGRRRSRSTNAPRRTRNSGNPSRNPIEKRNDHTSGDTRTRSRSLPRSLKRMTSLYRKTERMEVKDDPPSSTEILSPSFVDQIFGAAESQNVSPLGSNCEGIECQPTNQATKYSHRTFSPHSREESEPRVCVEFSSRKSGGYFQTTSYENQKSTDQTSYNDQRRTGSNQPRRYADVKAKTPDDASNIMFNGYGAKGTQALPKNFSKSRNTDRFQIDAISEKASRNLLLSPNGEEDSVVSSDNLFDNYRPATRGKINFATEKSNQFPTTPTPEKQLRREFSGRKSIEFVYDPDMTRKSMTPAGRKDLIQRYLSLRENHNNLEGPSRSRDQQSNFPHHRNASRFSSGRSVGSEYNIDYDDNSIAQDSSAARSNKVERKNGYDDASTHYQLADSPQWRVSDSLSEENNARSHVKFAEQTKRPATPLSSGSFSSMSGAKENLFPLPNAYKEQMIGKESFRSPSLVSSFPFSQQEKLSYSYASDDSSMTNALDGYKSNLTSPYNFPARSNYEEELAPHNQFMKMQMGIGN